MGSPDSRCTQTSGSFWTGGSATSRTLSPSLIRSTKRSRPAKTIPCTVDRKHDGQPGGNGGGIGLIGG